MFHFLFFLFLWLWRKVLELFIRLVRPRFGRGIRLFLVGDRFVIHLFHFFSEEVFDGVYGVAGGVSRSSRLFRELWPATRSNRERLCSRVRTEKGGEWERSGRGKRGGWRKWFVHLLPVTVTVCYFWQGFLLSFGTAFLAGYILLAHVRSYLRRRVVTKEKKKRRKKCRSTVGTTREQNHAWCL